MCYRSLYDSSWSCVVGIEVVVGELLRVAQQLIRNPPTSWKLLPLSAKVDRWSFVTAAALQL